MNHWDQRDSKRARRAQDRATRRAVRNRPARSPGKAHRHPKWFGTGAAA